MSFLYACPGISPQRRHACSFEFIAQSYPHRTAIQLSKDKYPLTYYQWERLFFRVFEKYFLSFHLFPPVKAICTPVFKKYFLLYWVAEKIVKN